MKFLPVVICWMLLSYKQPFIWVFGEKTYNFQELPITVKIGQCVNLTAKSYFSTITQISNEVEITWKKDTHQISNKKAWLYVDYTTTEDGAYYQSVIYNRKSNIREMTDFWINVVDCQANEKESKSTAKKCTSSCKEVCPQGWAFLESSYGDKCFKYFPEPKTWPAAQDACQNIGSQLAKIESLQENNFIGALLQTGEGGWIGLNDRSSESTFIWNFDKQSTPKYLSWATTEPNNYNAKCNIENCVLMSKQTGRWSDVICNAFYPFVCEVPWRNDTAWTCAAAKCYRFFAQQLTWHDALTFCKSFGGSLSKIHSSSENQIVNSAMNGDSWIGLNDIAEAGNFVWNEVRYSAQTLQFVNWASNEPNDMVFSDQFSRTGCPGEDCVLINTWQAKAHWYDMDCSVKKPYICERVRDRLLSSGAIASIVIGCMIAVAVVTGIVNSKMRKRSRAQIKATLVAAYEQEYFTEQTSSESTKTLRRHTYRNVVKHF